jgi:hypothetical protein
VGFTGDRYHRPFQTIGDFIPYTGSVMAIDPSGRGKDETGYAIVKMLNGYLYVTDCGGIGGGYEEKTLKALSIKASQNNVNFIVVESNFGDGMFTEMLKPILTKIHPCTIEEVRHNVQKEKRIVDTLEPVMNQHRLVIDPKVIKRDFESAQSYPPEQQLKYQLFYQMSRLTPDRGSLVQDDRLDALSIAVNYWTEQMAQDANRKMAERKRDIMKQEVDKFVNTYYKRTKGKLATTWF